MERDKAIHGQSRVRRVAEVVVVGASCLFACMWIFGLAWTAGYVSREYLVDEGEVSELRYFKADITEGCLTFIISGSEVRLIRQSNRIVQQLSKLAADAGVAYRKAHANDSPSNPPVFRTKIDDDYTYYTRLSEDFGHFGDRFTTLGYALKRDGVSQGWEMSRYPKWPRSLHGWFNRMGGRMPAAGSALLTMGPPVRQLIVPLWLPTVIFGMLSARFLTRRRRRVGHCSTCEYDLTANTSGICPECGVTVEGLR